MVRNFLAQRIGKATAGADTPGQAPASLGELAASVAHEVKNPLAGIKLAIQVLAKEPRVADSQRETIQEIVRSIDRLDKTITDLLSYSRISSPVLKPSNLHEVIEAALFSVKEEAQGTGVRVEKLFDLTLPLLPLDPQQMEGLLNLFLNACRPCPGGLTVQTKRRDSGDRRQENLRPRVRRKVGLRSA
jgi:two-component system sensor histidine kinase AtoS